MYKDILSKLTNGVDLNAEEVSEIISDIREDRLTEGQISGFLDFQLPLGQSFLQLLCAGLGALRFPGLQEQQLQQFRPAEAL